MPLAPAVAVSEYVFRLKAAVTDLAAFMVTEQLGEVPVHAPDHPAKFELEPAAAVRVTTVPAAKVVPAGFAVTVPVPAPLFATVSVYPEAPDWLTVNVFPAAVIVPLLESAEFAA